MSPSNSHGANSHDANSHDANSHDAIVVGSGPAGVNAASALIAAGRRVLMLDYGNVDSRYAELMPQRPFSEIRRQDPQQHRYFLGDDFEGIPFGDVRVGAQLTPPRLHVLDGAEKLQGIESSTFSASTSLARGGLGAAWGAGVFPFAGDELAAMGSSDEQMQPHYDRVSERIGVAGDHDDLERFFAPSPSMMPSLRNDTSAATIMRKYRKKRQQLNQSGFFLGKTRLAVCSREHRGRQPHSYLDMDYWADFGRSVYRSQWTLGELEAEPGFTYLGDRFVESFEEAFKEADGSGVTVTTRDRQGNREQHRARSLVLAAGAIGTARLVLRSLEQYDVSVPILCNPYAYAPMINLGMLGKEAEDQRHSMAQLTAMVRVANDRVVQAQVFSYRSLLTFKLMKESPLAYRQTRSLMQMAIPLFAILGIHHPDQPTADKTCRLERRTDGTDRLVIDYACDAQEQQQQRRDEKKLMSYFRRLGCLPLKVIRPGHGANIHYAGTLPISMEDKPLTCDANGQLRGTHAVYVADGAVFPSLPAKGLTFTIMAHADRVGSLLAERLA